MEKEIQSAVKQVTKDKYDLEKVDERSADDISFSCTNYKKVGLNKGTRLTRARRSPPLFTYSLGVSLFFSDLLIHQKK